jgi:DNA-binding response OmpR family regulator
VIVVEDEGPVCEAVVEAMRHEGFAARGLGDAGDVGPLLAWAPDLAILDVMLPGRSGFTLAPATRADRFTDHLRGAQFTLRLPVAPSAQPA